MATSSKENIELKGPDDWESWSTQFKSKAISTKIWKLISPRDGQDDTEPFAEEPIPPRIRDYDKKLDRTRLQSGQSNAAAQGSQGSQPIAYIEEVDHGHQPRTAAEMTTEARQAFQLDWTLYQHDFKRYTAETDAIDNLKSWVHKTTSKHLIRTACNPEDTIKDWYEKLKKQIGVSDDQLTNDVRALYKAAVKPLTKAPRDPLAWLDTWE
jgi:hypothetical protein